MKRTVPLPWCAALAAGVFVVTFAALGATYFFAFDALRGHKWERVAMFALLFVWSLIAYFPARWAYLAAAFRHFYDGVHCEGCQYNLTGNRSGRCPECGRPVPQMWAPTGTAPGQSKAPSPAARPPGRPHRGYAIGSGCLLVIIVCISAFVWKGKDQRPTVPPGFETAAGDFCFVRWTRESSMQDVDPHSVFAIVNGVVRARFTFQSGEGEIIDSVGLSDALGRPWVDLDFVSGRYMVNHYPSEQGSVVADPAVTYIDSDRDSLLDERKDWESGDVSCLERAPTWNPCGVTLRNEDGSE